MTAFAFGLGVGTHNSKGEWLEVFFPQPLLAPSATLSAVMADFDSGTALEREQLQTLQSALQDAGEGEQAALAARFGDSDRPAVAVLLKEDVAPANVPDLCEPAH